MEGVSHNTLSPGWLGLTYSFIGFLDLLQLFYEQQNTATQPTTNRPRRSAGDREKFINIYNSNMRFCLFILTHHHAQGQAVPKYGFSGVPIPSTLPGIIGYTVILLFPFFLSSKKV